MVTKKYIILTVQISILCLFAFCKKDWGTSEYELYNALEGPVAGNSRIVKDIEIVSSKKMLEYGGKCQITISVSEIHIDKYGDTVSVQLCPPENFYYVWKFSETGISGSYYFSYTYCGFKLNGASSKQGYGVNNITLSVPKYDSIPSGYRTLLEQIKIVLIECRLLDYPNDDNYCSSSISVALK